MSWIDDPKLARQLARASWLVLVAAAVLLTRFPLPPTWERVAIAGLIVVTIVLNAPVISGLMQSRDEASSAAWRAVAVALALRVAGTVGVVTWITVA